MSWSEAPVCEDVQIMLRDLAQARAQLRLEELRLEILKARMDKVRPRTPHVRIIGVDADSEIELATLQFSVAEFKGIVDRLEADAKFHEYRRDMYRALSYRERL